MSRSRAFPSPMLAWLTAMALLSHMAVAEDSPPTLLEKTKAHLDLVLKEGTDRYGVKTTPLWMSSIDTRTGRYPEDDTRHPDYPSRVYRLIAAPKGSNPYWDLPQMAAAADLSKRTGDPSYRQGTDDCLDFVFSHLIDGPSGLILWGNHYYYHAYQDQILFFLDEKNVSPYGKNPAGNEGKYHEARPVPIPWDLLWERSPEKTERYIRAMLDRHLTDPATGEFNRHATPKGQQHAFIESGGLLVHAAAFLFGKTKDPALLERADLFIRYTLAAENPDTGLVSNCPNSPAKRWDYSISSTEIGLWAGSLIEASSHVPAGTRDAWLGHADRVTSAWLKYAWSGKDRKFHGNLRITDGAPVTGRTTVYQPGAFSNLWEPQFPNHDYPMAMAETCLRLHKITGKETYRTACERWITVIRESLPAREGKGGYAEHYGRVIHFLLGCHRDLEDPACLDLAKQVAAEADRFLWAGKAFRSHPVENRCDSVDGMGYLLLALGWLETGKEPDYHGFFF